MSDRRAFLVPQAQAPKPARRRIRVGALSVGEGAVWRAWADILSPQGGFGTRFLNMEVTHCWDVNPRAAQNFAAKYDCLVVPKYDGMIGKVDAVACSGLYEVPWQHLLVKPYLESGVPTYLMRPFSYRLRDIDLTLDLAAKHNTLLMGSSLQEHYYQASYIKQRLQNVGVIKSVHGIGWSDEYPAHFHIQWFILRALGYNVDKVSVLTDNELKASYLQQTLLFRGWEGQPPFLACLHAVTGTHYLYLKVIGDKGTEVITMDRSPNLLETQYHYFAPQLVDMQRSFEGHNYQPFDIVRKKTQIFLAGYYSHLEKGGALIPVDSVPVEWSPRHWKPNWVDESIFRSGTPG